MRNRIAIMRDGALVQYDTPEGILARPADAFVESFVGTDRALKRLALLRAEEVLETQGPLAHSHTVDADTSLRDALATMFAAGVDALTVLRDGAAIGVVTVAAIRRHALVPAQVDTGVAPP